MRSATFKLLLPVVAITIQNNSASTIIPPFLQDLHTPVAAIGTLISLNPVLALISRLPVGMAYHRRRARSLIAIAVLAMGITNFLYSFAAGNLTFAVIHSLNGFAYGAVTTLYMAFYVDSLPPDRRPLWIRQHFSASRISVVDPLRFAVAPAPTRSAVREQSQRKNTRAFNVERILEGNPGTGDGNCPCHGLVP
jgi:predicted MFS family arabinose efflux permease